MNVYQQGTCVDLQHHIALALAIVDHDYEQLFQTTMDPPNHELLSLIALYTYVHHSDVKKAGKLWLTAIEHLPCHTQTFPKYCFGIFLRIHGKNRVTSCEFMSQAFRDDPYYLQYQKLEFALREYKRFSREKNAAHAMHTMLTEFYYAEQYYRLHEMND